MKMILKRLMILTLSMQSYHSFANTLTTEEVQSISEATESRLNNGILSQIYQSIANLKGEKGDKGDKGDQGEPGTVDNALIDSRVADVLNTSLFDWIWTKFLRLEANASVDCVEPGHAGRVRFNNGVLESCNGVEWQSYKVVQEPQDYQESKPIIRTYEFPAYSSGHVVTLLDENGNPYMGYGLFRFFCHMTTATRQGDGFTNYLSSPAYRSTTMSVSTQDFNNPNPNIRFDNYIDPNPGHGPNFTFEYINYRPSVRFSSNTYDYSYTMRCKQERL